MNIIKGVVCLLFLCIEIQIILSSCSSAMNDHWGHTDKSYCSIPIVFRIVSIVENAIHKRMGKSAIVVNETERAK